MASRKRPRVGDPRKLGGRIVDVAGDPLAKGGVVIDTRDAVLLETVDVCLVDAVRGGRREERPLLALELGGRINKTSDEARILYLFDEDGAAAIVTELLGLAVRIGPDFAARFIARTEEVLKASRPADG